MRQNLQKIFFLAIMLLPTFAFAESFTYNYIGIEFKCVVQKGYATIYQFDPNFAKVVVPANVSDGNGNTYSVSKLDLAYYAFPPNYKTQSIFIEEGVQQIAARCFASFKYLTQVTIPKSVEKIGKNAFNKKYFPMQIDNCEQWMSALKSGLAVSTKATMEAQKRDMIISGSSNKPTVASSVKQPTVVTGWSDVDDAPVSRNHRDNYYVLIIANEDYANTSKVNYAKADGDVFAKYCVNTLGIPSNKIHSLTNGSFVDMKREINNLKKMANAATKVNRPLNFLIYYSGHGVPDESGKCYFLPVDGDPHDPQNTAYSLNEISDALNEIQSSNALMFVDACFSGSDRNDVCLYDGSERGLKPVYREKVNGNVVVFSASSKTETSMGYDERAHGLFSYFLFKKLQETKGDVNLGELYDYVRTEVVMEAANKGKSQEPSINPSDKLSNSWRQIKF